MTVQSLYVGYSGLNAMSHNIDVIGNNIANVNTVGFRSGRATFDDIFYSTLYPGAAASGNRGGINPRQVGTGVELGSVDNIFTQGSTQNTGRQLDMSVSGDGFFVLQNGAGQEFLTRAGNFSIDEQGFMVDPASGLRLIGRNANEEGVLNDQEAPGELEIDFSQESLAQQTENVRAGGNFDNRIGDPNRDQDVSMAQSTTNLLGLFSDTGDAFGLVNGDVLQFETGFLNLGDPPSSIDGPIDLSSVDGGRGNGVLLSVTSETTISDLETALNGFIQGVVNDVDSSADSNISVSFNNNSGQFEFNNFGENALQGLRIGVAPRGDSSSPPSDANRAVGNLFINEGDPNLTRTLDVAADSVVRTNTIREADTTSSIDVFDSQGGSHTVTVGMASDTDSPAAIESTTLDELQDGEGRSLIPGGAIPAEVEYSDPVIDSATNTAVYTASQVNNMVVTQGVYSFNDANGNLIALRLSDGALSFNGGAFNQPIQADGTVLPELADAGLDVTGDSFLNLPRADNAGGGLLGDEGFTESTTVEDIRSNIQDRLNTSIQQIASNLANIDPATTTLQGVPAGGLAAPEEIPSLEVNLSEEGSFEFSSEGGSLGASASDDDQVTQDLITQAGGANSLGMVLDLAAQTRSVRVSTIDPRGTIGDPTDDFADGQVDNSFEDGGGITGFLQSVNPFEGALDEVFTIGNTDFNLSDATGDPTADPPTGVDDSGVHLIALSSGQFPQNDALADQSFDGERAFEPQTSALQALFNQRGYGVASNFDDTPGIDRSNGVPVGIVAEDGATRAFETNTIHRDGRVRSTVNYQVVVPSDSRTLPTQTTGSLIFDSNGQFQRYGESENAPTVTFDPDNADPENGGVNPIGFNLDLSGVTYFSGASTAQLVGQDGRPVGSLDDISINPNGEIVGIFTNGDAQTLGQILLADVTNPDGLLQEGGTLFTTSPNSGERFFVEPDLEGGSIQSGQLELSNVDLAKEFSDLIVAQRAYQANSRIVTTSDQILTETVNLKR